MCGTGHCASHILPLEEDPNCVNIVEYVLMYVMANSNRKQRCQGLQRTWLTVPLMTWSPGDFGTGADSPVSIASSTNEWPAITSPSAGSREPGRICSIAADLI